MRALQSIHKLTVMPKPVSSNPNLAKLTAPTPALDRVYRRARLFERLDAACKSKVV